MTEIQRHSRVMTVEIQHTRVMAVEIRQTRVMTLEIRTLVRYTLRVKTPTVARPASSSHHNNQTLSPNNNIKTIYIPPNDTKYNNPDVSRALGGHPIQPGYDRDKKSTSPSDSRCTVAAQDR